MPGSIAPSSFRNRWSMQRDEIDEMLSGAVPIPHPDRWRAIDAESRSLTGGSGETPSEVVAAEIRSKTHGTRESGDDFLTAATRAVGHAVRTVAAEFKDPAESARAITAGVLRGAGENEDMALKTLSLAARSVLREALLLGYGPTPWIEGILSGALDGARDLGLHRENAVAAATQGILRAADETRLVERMIHGILASLADPVRKSEA